MVFSASDWLISKIKRFDWPRVLSIIDILSIIIKKPFNGSIASYLDTGNPSLGSFWILTVCYHEINSKLIQVPCCSHFHHRLDGPDGLDCPLLQVFQTEKLKCRLSADFSSCNLFRIQSLFCLVRPPNSRFIYRIW